MGYLVELVLEVHRGMKAEGAVEPLAVVEDFDVFEDFLPRGGRSHLHGDLQDNHPGRDVGAHPGRDVGAHPGLGTDRR